MSIINEGKEMNEDLLPDTYDQLVRIDKLVHGEHNPRRVQPSSSLRRSVNEQGINDPLIVRPDDEKDLYHITDGWQRYQAATECGWEQLPVKIFDSSLDALKATESASIVREWSTYEWANYCWSLAKEIDTKSMSKQELVEQVANRTVKSPQTVRRYLDVLSLPDEIFPLLNEGPDGSQQEWTALQNHNENVRYYGDLWWTVAARLGRNQSNLSRSRVLRIAAKAVEFEEQYDAQEFVDQAIANPEERIENIQKKILFDAQYNRYLEVPRVAVKLDKGEKQAIMDYCYKSSQSLSKIIEDEIRSLADELN